MEISFQANSNLQRQAAQCKDVVPFTCTIDGGIPALDTASRIAIAPNCGPRILARLPPKLELVLHRE